MMRREGPMNKACQYGVYTIRWYIDKKVWWILNDWFNKRISLDLRKWSVSEQVTVHQGRWRGYVFYIHNEEKAVPWLILEWISNIIHNKNLWKYSLPSSSSTFFQNDNEVAGCASVFTNWEEIYMKL